MNQAIIDAVVKQLAAEIEDTDDFDALELQVVAASRQIARQVLQRKSDAKKKATEEV
jgi:hypothetical protein